MDTEESRAEKDEADGSSEDRLRAILEQASPLILQMDQAGIIRFASGFHLAGLGLSEGDLLGSSFVDFVNADDRTHQTFQQAMAGEFGMTEFALGGCEFEVRLTPMVDQLGNIAGVTAVFVDITDRVRAAAELQRSEGSFRALIESSPDAVFVHRFGRIVYANEATCRLLRHDSIDHLLGSPVLEIFAKQDRPLIADRIRTAARTSENHIDRLKLNRRDGDQGNFEITTIAVQYDGDAAIVHIARDVTQALRLQKNLAQAERLASLGTLAGGVGHEINNPLAYMTANLSFIADELEVLLPVEGSPEHADIHSALRDVRDGTDRVRDIVRQLNEFNKVDSDAETLIDPRAAVETAIRMSWNHLRRHARIQARLQSVGSVLGTPARLGQVLLALLLSASEALEGQPIDECELVIGCYEEDEMIRIDVADSGPGIPDALLANIFDPFSSGIAKGVGTGLGLSVAHSIVTSMGGHIEVDTQLGRGTSMRIHLPRAQVREAETSDHKTVLVITDEVRFLEAAQIALRGHTLRVAGRMSIAQADLAQGRFDAILCDLSSADMEISTFGALANGVCDALLFVAQSGTPVTQEERALASNLLRKPVGADSIAMQLSHLWTGQPPLRES